MKSIFYLSIFQLFVTKLYLYCESIKRTVKKNLLNNFNEFIN